MAASSTAQSYVLFVDHQGHVAPMGRCYHATASRRLSSSVERHPPSTVTEIDSAYCPRCLSFHDAASAAQLGYCPKPTCQECPKCQSVASITIESQQCYYICGFCDYNSQSAGLAVPCTAESEAEAATTALGKLLESKRFDGKQNVQFQDTLKKLDGVAVEDLRRQKNPNHIYKESTSENLRPWNMKALNESLETKAKKIDTSKGLGEAALKEVPHTTSFSSVTSLLLSPAQLPLAIPLRARKSRRCRAELKEGRPGILVKPKLNPLEGDTSLRSGHGQWFKKDSSAILVVPRVTIEKQDGEAVLLRVHNPTLGVVKLSFGPSPYQGEPTFEDPSIRTPALKHVLVDSLRNTTINSATLDTAFQLTPSKVVSLEAVEDTFLEFGKGVQLPKIVQEWNAATSHGWIAQEADKAWFSFSVGSSKCVPLSVTMAVTKGSWESSLIKSTGKDDAVTFDLVILRT
jgi:dynactin-4